MRLRTWLFAAIVIAVCSSAGWAGIKAGSEVTIKVMSAKVMKSPKHIGTAAGNLSRGDQLTVKEVKGDWYRVEGAATGWIHKTNIVEGKHELNSKPGGGGSGASQDEVELAGRGFTPQVEQSYRDANPNLDFAHVDAIETITIDPGELDAFVAEGGIGGGS